MIGVHNFNQYRISHERQLEHVVGAMHIIQYRIFVWRVIVAVGLPLVAVADADAIFQRVAPAIVGVDDGQGSVSGVVIDGEHGLIVVPYFAAISPGNIVVTAVTGRRKRRRVVRFDRAQLVRVHPTFDLAILKVDLGSVPLVSCPIRETSCAVGDDAYVVATQGSLSSLGATIESCIISAMRTIGDEDYIQINTSAGPSQVGGAVVDREGHLVAVVSHTGMESNGVAFSVSSRELSAMIVPHERVSNEARAMALVAEGEQLLRAAGVNGAGGGLALAVIAYRRAVAEAPNSAGMYHIVGQAWRTLNRDGLAQLYFERAGALDPTSVSASAFLGDIYRRQGDGTLAQFTWERGLTSTDPAVVGECAERLARHQLEQEQFVQAAYFSKWSLMVSGFRPSPERVRLWHESAPFLNAPQHVYMSLLGRGAFSLADLELVMQLTEPKPQTVLPTRLNNPVDEARARALTTREGRALPGATGVTKRIPDDVYDAKLAYYGAYLILQFRSRTSLGVFDIAAAKFVKHLPIGTNKFLFAAGGESLYVYTPSLHRFEHWSLVSMEKVREFDCYIAGEVTNLEMGFRNSNDALIAWAIRGAAPELYCGAIDLVHNRLTTIELAELDDLPLTRAHIRPDMDMNRVVMGDAINGGIYFLTRANEHGWQARYTPGGRELSNLSATKSIVFTSGGRMVNVNGETLWHDKSLSLLPIHGSDGYVEVTRSREPSINIRSADGKLMRTVLSPVKLSSNRANLSFDRSIYAVADLNRIVFIDNSTNRVVIHTLDLAVRPTRELSAGQWEYPFACPEGATVSIISGPTGIVYEPELGKLRWRVQPVPRAGDLDVLLRISMPGGTDAYERVEIKLP